MSDEAPERIWRLDCQGEVYYLEIPPQDQTLADSVEYIRADKVKDMLAAEAVSRAQNEGSPSGFGLADLAHAVKEKEDET